MIRRKSEVTEQIENNDRSEVKETVELVGPRVDKINRDILIPSGSTLVNLACSDNPYGAYSKGTINTMPGKSQGGKSFMMMTMLACCAAEERFNDYSLIYDDAEETMSFDLEELFYPLYSGEGDPTYLYNGRLIPPDIDKKTKKPICSNTIQDFKANIIRWCQGDKPFIYILDSLDVLTSSEEMKREYKEALKSGNMELIREAKGSYKMEKAKHIGETLRIVNGLIKRTGSALFIIQQTRQNISGGFGAKSWKTSGGEGPFFYSYHQLYFSEKQQITDTSHGLTHKIGGVKQVEVVKNKLTGKKRKDGVEFPMYESFGVDDIASCVDFLKKTKHWKSDSAGVTATEFDIKLSRDKLVEYIEENRLDEQLQGIVGNVWNEIEDSICIKRRRRF